MNSSSVIQVPKAFTASGQVSGPVEVSRNCHLRVVTVPEQLGNYRRSISVCPITEAVHGATTDAGNRNPGADVASVEIDVHRCLCKMARPGPGNVGWRSKLGQQLAVRDYFHTTLVIGFVSHGILSPVLKYSIPASM
tara:strand:- start:1991 stop:2401 length:411 start_codon:yes stop_codon:yes gene_type:complete